MTLVDRQLQFLLRQRIILDFAVKRLVFAFQGDQMHGMILGVHQTAG